MPGLAVSGVDYNYDGTAPIYPIGWEYYGPTRDPQRRMLGNNSLMLGRTGAVLCVVWPDWSGGHRSSASSTTHRRPGNLSAQFQMANPNADMFYLGGQLIPLGVALGEPAAPLTIVDNSHQDGVFGFTSSSYTTTNSPATVGISRAVSSYGTVQVSYQTVTNGTAVPGTDYQSAAGVVTFNPSQTNSSFPVTILNNSYIASVEKTVTLQLFNLQDLSSGNATLGLTNALLRIINPNYQGYLNFTTNLYAGNLSSGAINVIVSRTVGSKGSLTVQYATTNGTAISGVDYVGVTNTLSWNNGDVTPRAITIPLIANNLIGSTKQFAINLFNPTLNGASAPSLFGAVTNATLLIINDNSYGTFQFSAPCVSGQRKRRVRHGHRHPRRLRPRLGERQFCHRQWHGLRGHELCADQRRARVCPGPDRPKFHRPDSRRWRDEQPAAFRLLFQRRVVQSQRGGVFGFAGECVGQHRGCRNLQSAGGFAGRGVQSDRRHE